MKTVLIIDSSNNRKIAVGVRKNGNEVFKEKELGKEKNQILLSLIDELLKEQKIKKEELASIEVNTGPGSFTGLRVGISIANALSYSLNIPINGKKPGSLRKIEYD